MGASLAYMDEPIKDIHWDEGQDERQSFVIGEMQGWRLNMVSLIHFQDSFYTEKPSCLLFLETTLYFLT